jgi:mono/diheme cytochrome c family protein
MNKTITMLGSLVLISFVLGLSASTGNDSKAAPPETPKPDLRHYKEKVLPILQSACVKCHSADKPKGDFRIDNLDPDLEKGKDAAKWEEVLNQMQTGAMPPKSEKPLGKAEREVVTSWLQKEMQRAAELKASTGGRGVIRRLTRYEYNYTIQDLLELPLNVAKTMPEDRADPTGLKNNGQHLGMSTSQLEMYFESATTALKKAMVAPEKPKVYHTRFKADAGHYTDLKLKSRESDHVASGPGVKVPEGVKLPPGAYDQFFFEAPRAGRFRISFTAGGASDLDGNHPRLQVWFGYQSTASLLVRELIAEVAIDAPLDKPKEYVVYGYLEECPLPRDAERGPAKKGGNKIGMPMVYLMHAYDSEHAKGVIPKKGPAKPDKTPEHEHTVLLQSFDFQAPYFEAWPPKSRTAVLGAAADVANPAARAGETLTAFTSRAWRRPVTNQDVDPLVKMFEGFYKDGKDYDAAMRDTLATALLSPKFLYVVEPVGDARRDLTAHELASRLSYFLWCSLPDAELRTLADSGELMKDAVLAGQVRRMLADPKARRFARNFTEQWLEADQIDRVAVNPEYFPSFRDDLKKSLRKEPTELFWHILTNGRSAMEFLASDYVVVDQALAAHYGLKGVIGSEFRPVKVRPENHRGGLLTMGCFMLANSNGAESHPILRGKWLLKNLMNEPPPAPPPGVPELSQIKGFEKMTLKRQLEVHREHAACASCHDKLDPWGLALENFDAVGQWRASAKKVEEPAKKGPAKATTTPVDAAVKLPDGAAVSGIDELKQYCVRVKGEDFARALTRKLLAYALGRSLEWTDRADVDKLTKKFADSDFKLTNLITEIVLSHPFRTR